MVAGVFTMSYAAESLLLKLGRKRRLLLVGLSHGATDLVSDLAANPKLPFEWVGAVAESATADAAFPIPVLGTMADLPRIVLNVRPDLVVVVKREDEIGPTHTLKDSVRSTRLPLDAPPNRLCNATVK